MLKLALSRTAQRGVFALWVFTDGATGRLSSIGSLGFQLVAAPPGGRMHRLLTTLGRGFKERIGWKRLGIAASLLIIAFAITHAGPHPQGRRYRRDPGCADGNTAWPYRAGSAVRGRGVLHADILRFLRAANHRQEARALSHRRAVELHQLYDRPQYRRHRVHRRRDPLPDLFGLRPERDRRRQDLLSFRPDVLARQYLRARHRHGVASLGGVGDGSAAARDQPADRARWPRRHRRLSGLARHSATAGASSGRTAGKWCCPRRG